MGCRNCAAGSWERLAFVTSGCEGFTGRAMRTAYSSFRKDSDELIEFHGDRTQAEFHQQQDVQPRRGQMCHSSCITFGKTNLTKDDIEGKRVLEVGSFNVNGSLRTIVETLRPQQYVGVDFQEGPGVD